MLDDLKMIHSRDKADALGVAGKQWRQLGYNFETQLPSDWRIHNVVLAGMGGSAFPGVFLEAWPGTAVPFTVVRDYQLPKFVNGHTLVIVSSYSGNTEETLAALGEAERRGALVAVISAGGKLLEKAQSAGYPLYEIPGGIQPRMCAFYFWKALVQILEPFGIAEAGSAAAMAAAGQWLQGQTVDWQPEIPVSRNPAKQLAQELIGLSLVVYSGPKLFPAANKWKICTNENAKTVAWTNQFSEYNHNEFIGWSGHPVDKPYAVIEIRSDLEHPQIQKRFVISERLLSGKRPQPHIVVPQGKTQLEQIIWTSNFADYVSLYLALLNGIDPTPVNLVEKLKAELQ